jgi:leucyl aminopeptidase
MSDTIPLVALTAADLDAYLASAGERTRRWIASQQFKALPLTLCIVPNDDGGIAEVLVGVANGSDVNTLAHLPQTLPHGDYTLSERGLPLDAARSLSVSRSAATSSRATRPRAANQPGLAPLGQYLMKSPRWRRRPRARATW